MCELFGLSANREVSISFTWRGFLKRGERNYDGWGVAWYTGDGLCMVKEPRPSTKSPVARLLVDGIRGSIVISHVRFATHGKVSYVNTHPFARELYGREWVFAHNGSVKEIMYRDEFAPRLYTPCGKTDSEYAFCYMMDHLKMMGTAVNSIIMLSKAIWKMANKIGKYGKFNFLLSNGRFLFAYMNIAGTLHYVVRRPPHSGYVHLVDEDFSIKLEEIKDPSEIAALIATKPLTDEKWREFEPNTLYVFEGGELILKVDSHGNPQHTLEKAEVEVVKYVRMASHSVKVSKLSELIGISVDEVSRIVHDLVIRGYLRQHRDDKVPVRHPDARVFTDPGRREIIDTLLLR